MCDIKEKEQRVDYYAIGMSEARFWWWFETEKVRKVIVAPIP